MTRDEIVSIRIENCKYITTFARYEDDGTLLQYYTTSRDATPAEIEENQFWVKPTEEAKE